MDAAQANIEIVKPWLTRTTLATGTLSAWRASWELLNRNVIQTVDTPRRHHDPP